MPVDHSRKLLFIHIPKTGGTSILTLLGLWKKERSPDFQTLFGDFGPLDLQHLTLAQTERFLTPAEFASYFRFAFVRNPWDRAVSAALWRARFEDEGVRDLRDYIDWAEKVNAERVNGPGQPSPSDSHAMPQCHFLAGGDGREGVARIGRFENYERDLKAILGRFIKLPHLLPHQLNSGPRHYRDYYNGDLERRAARLFAQDVARFGYTF